MTSECLVCHATTSAVVASGHYKWCVCGNCGSWTLLASHNGEAYPADYFGVSAAKFSGLAGAIRHHFHSGRAKRIQRLVGKAGAILYDVGCGDGAFLSAARDLGFAVGGCEPEHVPRKQASLRLGAEIDSELFEEDCSDGCDVITSWQVIEHLPNPREFVRSVRNNLKPGGVFAISTVNIDSWQARLFGSEWLHLDPPRHLWCGPLKALQQLLIEEGFVIHSQRWNWQEFGPIGFVSSVLNCAGLPRDELVHKLKNGFTGIFDPTFWAASVLTPPSLALACVEAALGHPATFEIYAKTTSA